MEAPEAAPVVKGGAERALTTLVASTFGVPLPEDASRLGNRIRRLEGVVSARMDFVKQQLTVDYDPGVTSGAAIQRGARAAGYEISLPQDTAPGRKTRWSGRRWDSLALFVGSGAVLLELVGFGLSAATRWELLLLHALKILLSGGALGLVGRPRIVGLQDETLKLSWSPVRWLLGVNLVAFLWAGGLYIAGEGSWFHVSAGISVFVVLWERLAQGAVNRSRRFDREVESFVPKRVRVLREGGRYVTDGQWVRPTDRVVVTGEERVPVDGDVEDGSARGAEGFPMRGALTLKAGAFATAGTLLLDGEITISPRRLGRDVGLLRFLDRGRTGVRLALLRRDSLRQLLDLRGGVVVLVVAIASAVVWSAFGVRGPDLFHIAVGVLVSVPFGVPGLVRGAATGQLAGEFLLRRLALLRLDQLIAGRGQAFVVVAASSEGQGATLEAARALGKLGLETHLVVVGRQQPPEPFRGVSVCAFLTMEEVVEWIQRRTRESQRFLVCCSMEHLSALQLPRAIYLPTGVRFGQHVEAECVAQGVELAVGELGPALRGLGKLKHRLALLDGLFVGLSVAALGLAVSGIGGALPVMVIAWGGGAVMLFAASRIGFLR